MQSGGKHITLRGGGGGEDCVVVEWAKKTYSKRSVWGRCHVCELFLVGMCRRFRNFTMSMKVAGGTEDSSRGRRDFLNCARTDAANNRAFSMLRFPACVNAKLR